MNKRVLRTMICLCWAFLVAFAVLKLWFADKLLIVVNNAKIVEVGRFIDERAWLQQIVYGLTTLLTYQFFLCACIKKWHLTWKQYIVLCVVIAVTNTLKYYVPSLSLVVNVLVMVILPFTLKADYKTFIIVFTAHYLGQLAISYIRSEAINATLSANTATMFIIGIDMYIWLVLYYLYTNLYKENFIMGNYAPPLWKNITPEQLKKEIAKIDKKVDALAEKRAEYVKMLEELEAKDDIAD